MFAKLLRIGYCIVDTFKEKVDWGILLDVVPSGTMLSEFFLNFVAIAKRFSSRHAMQQVPKFEARRGVRNLVLQRLRVCNGVIIALVVVSVEDTPHNVIRHPER